MSDEILRFLFVPVLDQQRKPKISTPEASSGAANSSLRQVAAPESTVLEQENRALSELRAIFNHKLRAIDKDSLSLESFSRMNVWARDEERPKVQILDSKTAFDQAKAAKNATRLSEGDFEKLSKDSRKLLKDRFGEIVVGMEIADAINVINIQTEEFSFAFVDKVKGYDRFVLDMGVAYSFPSSVPDDCLQDHSGKTYCELLAHLRGADPKEPVVHVLGYAEYLAIRQNILRYEAGEISHISNQRTGEKFHRSHRNLIRTVDYSETETETETFEKNEFSSSERSELSNEISKQLDKQSETNFGALVSGKYGPVQLSANGGFSSSASSSSSSQTSSQFAQELTQKAEASLRETTREKRSRTSTHEVEVLNEHSVETPATSPQVGIYRWVDAIYENRLVSLGYRTILQMMVPTPAAAYIFFKSTNNSSNIVAHKPIHPSLNYADAGLSPLRSYKDITRANFQAYIQPYMEAVSEFVAPPPEYRNVSASFAISGADSAYEGGQFTAARGGSWEHEVSVPDGYSVVSCEVQAVPIGVYESVTFTIGQYTNWGAIEHKILTFPSGGFEDKFRVAGTNRGNGYLYLTLNCELTPKAFDNWRIGVFSTIMEAYNNMQSQYESQIAAAQIQAGLELEGSHPSKLRQIERAEFKKWFIEALTKDRFENWNAMKKASSGEPEIDFSQLLQEEDKVNFFNSAFEFNEATYTHHDYFWGNKKEHPKIFSYTSIDPQHEAFLRAGYSTYRVTVTPGYDAAVLHFLETGEIPDIPDVNDPLHQTVLSNVVGQVYDGTGTQVGSTWETKQGLNVVWLQNGDADAQLIIQ